ncbi:hypothetical protein ACFLZV_05895 [Candidatus Margulisiibacteriota bacterium]
MEKKFFSLSLDNTHSTFNNQGLSREKDYIYTEKEVDERLSWLATSIEIDGIDGNRYNATPGLIFQTIYDHMQNVIDDIVIFGSTVYYPKDSSDRELAFFMKEEFYENIKRIVEKRYEVLIKSYPNYSKRKLYKNTIIGELNAAFKSKNMVSPFLQQAVILFDKDGKHPILHGKIDIGRTIEINFTKRGRNYIDVNGSQAISLLNHFKSKGNEKKYKRTFLDSMIFNRLFVFLDEKKESLVPDFPETTLAYIPWIKSLIKLEHNVRLHPNLVARLMAEIYTKGNGQKLLYQLNILGKHFIKHKDKQVDEGAHDGQELSKKSKSQKTFERLKPKEKKRLLAAYLFLYRLLKPYISKREKPIDEFVTELYSLVMNLIKSLVNGEKKLGIDKKKYRKIKTGEKTGKIRDMNKRLSKIFCLLEKNNKFPVLQIICRGDEFRLIAFMKVAVAGIMQGLFADKLFRKEVCFGVSEYFCFYESQKKGLSISKSVTLMGSVNSDKQKTNKRNDKSLNAESSLAKFMDFVLRKIVDLRFFSKKPEIYYTQFVKAILNNKVIPKNPQISRIIHNCLLGFTGKILPKLGRREAKLRFMKMLFRKMVIIRKANICQNEPEITDQFFSILKKFNLFPYLLKTDVFLWAEENFRHLSVENRTYYRGIMINDLYKEINDKKDDGELGPEIMRLFSELKEYSNGRMKKSISCLLPFSLRPAFTRRLIKFWLDNFESSKKHLDLLKTFKAEKILFILFQKEYKDLLSRRKLSNQECGRLIRGLDLIWSKFNMNLVKVEELRITFYADLLLQKGIATQIIYANICNVLEEDELFEVLCILIQNGFFNKKKIYKLVKSSNFRTLKCQARLLSVTLKQKNNRNIKVLGAWFKRMMQIDLDNISIMERIIQVVLESELQCEKEMQGLIHWGFENIDKLNDTKPVLRALFIETLDLQKGMKLLFEFLERDMKLVRSKTNGFVEKPMVYLEKLFLPEKIQFLLINAWLNNGNVFKYFPKLLGSYVECENDRLFYVCVKTASALIRKSPKIGQMNRVLQFYRMVFTKNGLTEIWCLNLLKKLGDSKLERFVYTWMKAHLTELDFLTTAHFVFKEMKPKDQELRLDVAFDFFKTFNERKNPEENVFFGQTALRCFKELKSVNKEEFKIINIFLNKLKSLLPEVYYRLVMVLAGKDLKCEKCVNYVFDFYTSVLQGDSELGMFVFFRTSKKYFKFYEKYRTALKDKSIDNEYIFRFLNSKKYIEKMTGELEPSESIPFSKKEYRYIDIFLREYTVYKKNIFESPFFKGLSGNNKLGWLVESGFFTKMLQSELERKKSILNLVKMCRSLKNEYFNTVLRFLPVAIFTDLYKAVQSDISEINWQFFKRIFECPEKLDLKPSRHYTKLWYSFEYICLGRKFGKEHVLDYFLKAHRKKVINMLTFSDGGIRQGISSKFVGILSKFDWGNGTLIHLKEFISYVNSTRDKKIEMYLLAVNVLNCFLKMYGLFNNMSNFGFMLGKKRQKLDISMKDIEHMLTFLQDSVTNINLLGWPVFISLIDVLRTVVKDEVKFMRLTLNLCIVSL